MVKDKWIYIIVAAVMMSLQVAALVAASQLTAAVAVLSEIVNEEQAMQTLTTEWTDTEGLNQKVETEKEAGETATAHANRHKQAVDALKALFPPAP